MTRAAWLSVLAFVFCSVPCALAAIRPQDVTQPFWEPMPFATLPMKLTARAIFYQDPVSTQGKVYTVAGQTALTTSSLVPTNRVFRMNVATDEWQEIIPQGDNITARVFNGATLITNTQTNVSYIAIYGGYVSFLGFPFPIRDFCLLELGQATHTAINKGKFVSGLIPDRTCCATCDDTSPSCPARRGAPAMETFPSDPSACYLFGGQSDSGGFLSDLWEYDVVADAWTQQTITDGSMSPARIGFAVAALDHRPTKALLFFGGTYVGDYLDALFANDLWLLEQSAAERGASWSWTRIFDGTDASHPPARADALQELVGALFLVWGGYDGETDALGGPMYVLDTAEADTGEWDWAQLAVADAFEPPNLAGSGLVYIPTQGAMLSVGGGLEGGVTSDLLYKFHAEGLFPPVTRFIGDEVDDGFDFNLAQQSVTDFVAAAPHFEARPRSQDVPIDAKLSAAFVRLVELDESGEPVADRELLLPSSDFVVGYELLGALEGAQGTKVTVFTRHAIEDSDADDVRAATVRFSFYQFLEDTVVNAVPEGSPVPPVHVAVAAGRIKFSCTVADWPFVDPNAHTLLLEMELQVGQSANASLALDVDETVVSDDATETSLFNPEFNTSVVLGLIDFSVNDHERVEQVVAHVEDLGAARVRATFEFQGFASTLHYDPYIDVFFGGGGGGGGGGDGDGGDGDGGGGASEESSTMAIIIGCAVGGAALFIVAGLSGGAFALWWKRRAVRGQMNRMRKMTTVIDL